MGDQEDDGAFERLWQEARRLPPAEAVGTAVGLAGRLGLTDARLLLADVQQRVLLPFDPAEPSATPGEDTWLSIEGTVAGRCYRTEGTEHTDTDDGPTTVYLPLVDGAERLGVLCGTVERWEESMAGPLHAFAASVAGLLESMGPTTDVLVRARRLRPPSLAAEVQTQLLPPLTARGGAVTVSGVLEPAYDIGGDTFDYAINPGGTHLAIFDAMGHGLSATLMVAVAVGAYRHARRAGGSLTDCYSAVDEAVATQFGPDRFVTGVLAELHLDDGRLDYLIAGHHPALLLRGGAVVRHLDAATRLPFGLGNGLGPLPGGPGSGAEGAEAPGSEPLEPGDRVVVYTDGVIEARDADGGFFGLERLEDLLVRADAAATSVPETMRRLVHAVLDHQSGALQDDATLLMVEWAPA